MKRRKKVNIIAINVHHKKRIIIAILLLIILIAGSFLYMKYLVNPVIMKTSESKIKTIANRSMNTAVTMAMDQHITYDDLIHMVTDNSGKISMIQANSVQINALAKQITRTTQTTLREQTNEPISIAIGSFTGIPLFTNRGPKINIEINPYGDISCKFSSEFTTAGINQTQHKIYLNITTNVNIVFPTGTLKVAAKTDVLICESVIIGEIPATFLQSASLDEMMNLIPL